MKQKLAQLLQETEKAHANSGDIASNWPNWYAAYMFDKVDAMYNKNRDQPNPFGDDI